MDVIIQQGINAISLGAIYALFALGYAMVFSILGVLNLAHSAIFMWGAFIGLLAIDPQFTPVLFAFSIAALVAFVPAGAAEYWIFHLALPRTKNQMTRRLLRFGITIALLLPFLFFQRSITFNVTVIFGTGYAVLMGGLAIILLAAQMMVPHDENSERLSNLLLRIVVLGWIWILGDVIFTRIVETQVGMAFSPIIAFILAIIGGGIISVLLEFVAFRPLRERGAERLSQLISSIGAALILVNIAQFAFQQLFNRTEAYYPRDVAFLPGISLEPIVMETAVGELRIAPIRLVILLIAIVLMIALQYMVTRTPMGQRMRAVAYDQRIASLLGIDVSRVYIITFFMAGAFGGAAGMLYGMVFSNITPFIGENLSLIGLTAIVLGGLGSINGAVLGGFIVAALQTFSTAAGGSSYRDAIVFILLFLVLLIRPQGLLGQPENTRA